MSSSEVFVLYLFTVETSVQDLMLSVRVHISVLSCTYRGGVGNRWNSGIWKGFPLKNIPVFSQHWYLKQSNCSCGLKQMRQILRCRSWFGENNRTMIFPVSSVWSPLTPQFSSFSVYIFSWPRISLLTITCNFVRGRC